MRLLRRPQVVRTLVADFPDAELEGVSAEVEAEFAQVQEICRGNGTTHVR